MKKLLSITLALSLLIISQFALSGCGQKSQEQKNEEMAEKLLSTKPNRENIISQKDAYENLKQTIEEKLQGKKARLGKISGSNIDKNGKAKSWTFAYYTDSAKKDYTDVYTFAWVKGKPIDGYEELFSTGLNTADYDYIWKDIGNSWVDSSEIAEKVYGLADEVSEYGLRMELYWNTKTYSNGPIWDVGTNMPGAKHYYFDGKTGEQIKK